MKIVRTSPFESLFRPHEPKLGSQFGMSVPVLCATEASEQKRVAALGMTDVSGIPRATIKGEGGARVLEGSGATAPLSWFSAVWMDKWSFVARTGKRELWVEGPLRWADARSASTITHTREEASLLLTGARLPELLAECVAIPIEFGSSRLYMTEMLSVSAMLLPRGTAEEPAIQLWCDPSYALYVGDLLHRIATDLGGGWVGTRAHENSGLLPVWN